MPRIWTWASAWAAILLVGVGTLWAQAPRRSEDLLPSTTQGFVAVADVDQLTDRWDKTQVGQLMADPVMEPFAKDLRRQLQDRWSGIRAQLGLQLDDLKDVAGGEVGVGLIRPGPAQGALAVVADVTGHLPQANALLQKISKNLTQRGAKQTSHQIAGTTVIFFDVPPPKEDPDAERRNVIYFLSGNLLGMSDNLQVIQGILGRVVGNPGGSLSTVPGFQIVMKRCAADASGAMPQIRWFIHPLGYAEALRAATPEKHRRKGKTILEVLQNQGFEAIQGVGGFVDFAADGYELIHRTAVFAPGPYRKSMKMLVFPNGRDFAPQPWVPRDVATYTTFYYDVLNAFDNFGPLFDELSGADEFLFRADLKHAADLEKGILPGKLREEFESKKISLAPQVAVTTKTPGALWEIRDDQHEEAYTVRKIETLLAVYRQQSGIWKQVLESLEFDPNGPQINLREELMVHLGQRATVLTDYQLPITPTSERLLFAIETTNQAAVAKAIEKLFKNDPTIQRRVIEGHVIWEVVEEEQPKPPSVEFGDLPGLPGADVENEEEDEEVRLLPHRSVTVSGGHLYIASHLDFLLKVLEPREERQALGRAVDYRLIDATIPQIGLAQSCARMFSRTDEEYRPTYELIRQGKMPESETVAGRVLNAMFGTGEKGVVRPQRIEGEKMPDFDVVRRYLGPAGLVVATEPNNGWFFKGFTLKKQPE